MSSESTNRLWAVYQLLANLKQEGLRLAASRRVLINFTTNPPSYRSVEVSPEEYEARLAQLREEAE